MPSRPSPCFINACAALAFCLLAPQAHTAEPPAASVSPGEEGRESVLRQYELQLARATQGRLRFPRNQSDNHVRHEVLLAVSIDEHGMLKEISAEQPSGHGAFDESARQAVQRAKPAVTIPAALRGQAFVVRMRVVFVPQPQ